MWWLCYLKDGWFKPANHRAGEVAPLRVPKGLPETRVQFPAPPTDGSQPLVSQLQGT